MAARGSSIKERTEPPPPPRELTVEAIRQRAVDAGVAAQFDRFVRMSENAGLAVQPQRVSVRIAPQAGRRRYLTYASPEGEGLVLWAGQGPLRPTRAWHKWSWISARSSTRNCKSGQSSSTARTTCAGTCCYACWRTTWNGTCGGGWRRYCPRSAFLPGRAGSRLASGQQAVPPRSPRRISPEGPRTRHPGRCAAVPHPRYRQLPVPAAGTPRAGPRGRSRPGAPASLPGPCSTGSLCSLPAVQPGPQEHCPTERRSSRSSRGSAVS